jgi:hypothetical protein
MPEPVQGDSGQGDTAPAAFVPVSRATPAPTTPAGPGLPDGLRTGIEAMSGMSMDQVAVHYDSPAPARIGALAYTQGSEIFVGPGQESHLGHEAWHVVQQQQGRVSRLLSPGDGAQALPNQDPALEREAERVGSQAVRTTVSAPPGPRWEQRHPADPVGRRPIQAIMAVAEFQAATPAGLLKPRSTVTAIDQALATYIQTRTAANANALIVAINVYLAGDHDGARKLAAQSLLDRAQTEHALLQAIGDANAFLVDGLIDQVTLARTAQLVTLATAVGPNQATVLPLLIQTVDATNVNNLNMSGLVASMGQAHLPLLPAMIKQAGGVSELARLNTIVQRHPGNGALAFDLTREANDVAADFQRLAGEVPEFHRTAAPLTPAGVTAAVNAYNVLAANQPVLVQAAALAAVNTLRGQARIAHTQATAVNAAVPNSIPAGLLANLDNRILALDALVLGLGANPIGPPIIAAALAVRNLVVTVVDPRVVAIALANPAAQPAAALYDPAKTAVDAQFPTVDAVTAAAPQIVNTVNWGHFAVRHTAHYFDFGDIKDDNTQWPTTWAGNTDTNLEQAFVAVLNNLAAAGTWLRGGIPIQHQACPAGGHAQIAGLTVTAAPHQINVGQFFPEHGTGAAVAAGIHPHPGSTMRAIQKVL